MAMKILLICVFAGSLSARTMKLTAEDRIEIQELLSRYMFILDSCDNHNNGYDYADLYTPDGSFGTQYKGREQLAKAAGRTPDGGCSPDRLRGPNNQIHLNVGEVIVPTPEGAKGTSYLLMVDGPANQLYWAGWYEDVYVKTKGGWRFKSRTHVSGARAGIPAKAGAANPGISRDPLKWVDGR